MPLGKEFSERDETPKRLQEKNYLESLPGFISLGSIHGIKKKTKDGTSRGAGDEMKADGGQS